METRQQRRLRKSEANKLFKLPPGDFKVIDLHKAKYVPSWLTRAFMNNRYVVMIDDNAKTNKGAAIKAMIQRHDDRPIPNHWSEMQNIKNKIFGKEAVGVEYFPRESELTDKHNIYWMWIFENDILPLPI